MFLIDTNVASELTKRRPEPAVVSWIAGQRPEVLYLSAVTVAEIRYGVEAVTGGRRAALEAWLNELLSATGSRLLPVDTEVASAWGRLRRRADVARRSMPIMDAFLAATADVHRLTLVTRNTKHFEVWGGPLFNPWTGCP